jgi:hypothetical protein
VRALAAPPETDECRFTPPIARIRTENAGSREASHPAMSMSANRTRFIPLAGLAPLLAPVRPRGGFIPERIGHRRSQAGRLRRRIHSALAAPPRRRGLLAGPLRAAERLICLDYRGYRKSFQ